MREQWASIKGYEQHYEVSTLGRVRSVPRIVAIGNGACRTTAPRLLRQAQNTKTGYWQVTLCKDSKPHTRPVHRLVGETFLGIKSLQHMNHKDGDKSNNGSSNLEPTTPLDNAHHAVRHHLIPLGIHRKHTKMTDDAVRAIRILHRNGFTYSRLAALFGLHRQFVCQICLRIRRQHVK